MDIKSFVPLFLIVTFVLHGIAFTFLGLRRRKTYYFFLTGTFTFLTAIYLMKFEAWVARVPGIDAPVTTLLRIAAALCTLSYVRVISREEGSWLWKLVHRNERRDE